MVATYAVGQEHYVARVGVVKCYSPKGAEYGYG